MTRLCGSVKFFWALASGVGQGGAAFRPPLRRPSASRFASAAARSFNSVSAAALCLQFGLGLPDLLRTPLLVGDPIRHFVATLVVAMQLVLFGVRRFGGAEPTGNL